MKAFYNDIEPYSTELLELRVADGWLPDGKISSEDIRKVATQDLSQYGQCHLFAGIGGFPLGARLAGLPDVYRLFTAGFPCQPFSNAGRKAGASDSRYLWPETLAALKSHRPDVAVLENVSGLTSMAFPSLRSLMDIKTSLAGFRDYIYRKKELGILNHITDGLEEAGYSVQPLIIPACATDAKHRRDRIWIVAIRNDLANTGQRRRGEPNQRQNQQSRRTQAFSTSEDVADAKSGRRRKIRNSDSAQRPDSGEKTQSSCSGSIGSDVSNATSKRHKRQGKSINTGNSTPYRQGQTNQSFNDGQRCEWPVEPAVCRVVNGLPGRVDRIKGLGNAIVPQVVAEILTHIMTALEIEPEWH